MRKSRLVAISLLFVSSAWVFAGGCSSSGGGDHGIGPPGNTGGSVGGTQGGATIVAPGASGSDGGPFDQLNPLCGVGADSCRPDDDSSCRSYVPPSAGGAGPDSSAGASSGGAAGEGGMSSGGSPQGGAADAAGGAPTGGGGAENNAGGAGPSSAGARAGGQGGSGSDNPPGLASYSCQVARQGNQLLRQCVPAGSGKLNAPCFSAADCAPSFACVTEGDAGRCLPYCCDPNSVCTSGSYCGERALRKPLSDTSGVEPPHVPVCVPADNCSLEDQFPCATNNGCRCKGDTACLVVRDDGTTTCATPGSGQQGDACPCAWNHVCSSLTNKCVKICHTDPSKSECGEQKCQASSELPPNFGLCVGPVK